MKKLSLIILECAAKATVQTCIVVGVFYGFTWVLESVFR